MTIAELCVKRSVFAVMLVGFLLVLGIFSFEDLGVDLFPKTDPATVTVNVQLLGATAEEVSTQVILPLEEAVSSVSGLDELMSEASEGNAQITCKFVLSATRKARHRTFVRKYPEQLSFCRPIYCRRPFPKTIRTPTRFFRC